MARTRLHIPTAVVIAMTMAALVNIIEFSDTDERMTAQYVALATNSNGELRDLVENNGPRTHRRFLVYAQLRDVAPGATLTIPPGARLTQEHLRGLAATSQVHVRAYEPDVSAEVAEGLLAASVAEGNARGLGHYVIAVKPSPSGLVLVRHGDVTILTDVRLVPELPAAARG